MSHEPDDKPTEPPFRSLSDFDPSDPSHVAHLRAIAPLDAVYEANQPVCCCAFERDAHGAIVGHPAHPDCSIHHHQIEEE